MNKKVLTLCAGALLMSMTFGTALAHQPEYRNAFVQSGFDATPETVNQIDTTKWYQLRVPLDHLEGQDAYGLLVQTRDKQTGKVYLRVIPQGGVPLLPSLWKIKYNAAGDGVSGGHWTFINKETNLELSYDHTFAARGNATATDDNAVIEACNTTWEWYNTNKQGNDFGFVAPYAYTDAKATGEEVMCLRLTDGGLVYSYVGTHEEIIENNEVNPSLIPLRIQPVLAESIVLRPSDFNSMIDYNKTGHAQNGEFKFFYPNGNAMDTTRMTGFSAAAMKPGQMYHAAYDDISRIYEMALEQEGVTEDVTGKQEAVDAALAAFDEARNAETQAAYEEQTAAASLDGAKLSLKGLQDLIAKKNETLQTLKEGIYADANAIITNYSKTNGAFFTAVEEGNITFVEDMSVINGRKTAYENAQKNYIAERTIENAMAVWSTYFDFCGSPINSISAGYNSAYYDLFTFYIDGGLQTTVNEKDQCIQLLADIEFLESGLEAAQANVTAQEANYEAKHQAYLSAQAASNAAGQAWNNAKNELATAIGNQHAYERTKYILDEGYMRLKLMEDGGVNVANNNNYLMVDTTFWESNTQTGIVPNSANLKVVNKTPDSREAAAIAARYFFKLTYFPSQDSIVVEPLNASAISNREYNAGTKWIDSYAGQWFVWENDAANGSQPSNTFTRAADQSGLPIVVKLHPDAATSGLALTTGSANREADTYLRTRIGFNNPYDYLVRTTLPEGLYFIQNTNGSYVTANFEGYLQYDVPESGTQDYNNMPATMFVVEKAGCDNGSRVLIHNREYGNLNTAFEGQLYKHEDGSIYFINTWDYVEGYGRGYTNALDRRILAYGDDYVITPVTNEAALTDKNHGYNYIDAESLPYTEYALNYNSALNNNVYLNVDSEGYITYNGEGIQTRFELDTVYAANKGEVSQLKNYGYGAGVANLPQLQRQAYVLKVRDVNLIDNDTTYVALVTEPGKNAYYKAMGINDIRDGKGTMAQFYLKSDQIDAEDNEYYALIDVRTNRFWTSYLNGARQLNCTDSNGKTSYVDLDNEPQERASAFRLVSDNRPLYREVNDETINLFNNSGEKMIEEIAEGKAYNYLSFANDNSKNGALEVERLALDNDRMPQYLLGVAKDSIADGYWCENNTHGYFATAEEADAADKNHYVAYNGYTSGRFLVNFVDSVLPGSHAYNKPDEYTHRGVAVRLGFVEGVHMVVTADEAKNINDFLGTEVKAGEYFFTLVGGHTLADLKNEQGYIIPERLFSDKYTEMNTYTSGKHNNWSFSFRLIDEANPEEFLIESNLPEVSAIGSMEGAWIKDYNGCPVVSYIDGNHSTIEAVGDLKKDNVTDGEIFTLEATNETATANEEISANGEVSVVATDGAVIVKGAEGKNVVVSTILGKVVANEVLNSDNETIAAPAGIVVVSVDGESFKVAVK